MPTEVILLHTFAVFHPRMIVEIDGLLFHLDSFSCWLDLGFVMCFHDTPNILEPMWSCEEKGGNASSLDCTKNLWWKISTDIHQPYYLLMTWPSPYVKWMLLAHTSTEHITWHVLYFLGRVAFTSFWCWVVVGASVKSRGGFRNDWLHFHFYLCWVAWACLISLPNLSLCLTLRD